MKYPKSFQDLIDSFANYPGIGQKSAERLAFHTIQKLDKEIVERFATNLINAKTQVKKCLNCGHLCEEATCDICQDDLRENSLLIVESSKEVIVFEKTNSYKGKYHVLNGLISPMAGVGVEDINLNNLKSRISNESIKKIIIATSASIPGEMTAMYIKNILDGIDCYRIGYGLPVGADIEYADSYTLLKALEGIKKI